jgi:hypothetical protein
MSAGSLTLFVRDSNRIAGIHRDPTAGELQAHAEFMDLPEVRVPELVCFVRDLGLGWSQLRDRAGMDVWVGSHRAAPPGGPQIKHDLAELLTLIGNTISGEGEMSPWETHVEYQALHPFLAGNGHSGRALWAWQMRQEGVDPFVLPVLSAMYFQSLVWSRGQL